MKKNYARVLMVFLGLTVAMSGWLSSPAYAKSKMYGQPPAQPSNAPVPLSAINQSATGQSIDGKIMGDNFLTSTEFFKQPKINKTNNISYRIDYDNDGQSDEEIVVFDSDHDQNLEAVIIVNSDQMTVKQDTDDDGAIEKVTVYENQSKNWVIAEQVVLVDGKWTSTARDQDQDGIPESFGGLDPATQPEEMIKDSIRMIHPLEKKQGFSKPFKQQMEEYWEIKTE